MVTQSAAQKAQIPTSSAPVPQAPATRPDKEVQVPHSFSAVIYGAGGTGKTTSVITLLKAGFEVNFLGIDGNARIGIEQGFALHKLDRKNPKFAYMSLLKSGHSLSNLILNQKAFSISTVKDQLSQPDPTRYKEDGYMHILTGLEAFCDDDTGVSKGCVTSWDNKTVLVIDSLSDVVARLQKSTLGKKLILSQAERGIMQNILLAFLSFLTSLSCNVVLLAHPKISTDKVTAREAICPETSGTALDSKLLQLFTEVVWCYRTPENEFKWATKHKKAQTRATILPVGDALNPSFEQVNKNLLK